jgi:hypothetical protein
LTGCEELEFNDLIFKKLISLKANKVEKFLELLKTYLINFKIFVFDSEFHI